MDAATYYKQISKINAQNNAISQQNAREQMQFQDYMSSTAHQREVKDLKAAGLNPVLSAGGVGGGGAATGSGAMGQTDMSAASALTGYLQSLISQQTAIQVASINAGAMKYSADRAYESARDNANSTAGLIRRTADDFVKAFGLKDASGRSAATLEYAVEDFVKDATGSDPDSKALKILMHERQYNGANGILNWFAAWDYFLHEYDGPVKWFGNFWEQVWPDMMKAGYKY